MNTPAIQTSHTRNAPARPAVALANTLGGMVRYAAADPLQASTGVLMTFEAVAATPHGVVRHTWDGSYVEVLEISPAAVDLSRVTNGVCPLLANHDRWNFPDSHLGAVEGASFELGALILTGRFDGGPIGADIARRVNTDRTLRAVSVGYDPIEAVADGFAESGLPIVRITRWALNELSFVLVPADPVSGSRNWGALPHSTLENHGAPNPNGGHLTMTKTALSRAMAMGAMSAVAALQTRNQSETGAPAASGTLPRAPDAVRNVLSGLQTREAAPVVTAPAPPQTREDPAATGVAAPAAAEADAPAATTPTTVEGATGTVTTGDDGSMSVEMVLQLRSQADRLGVAPAAETAMRLRGATASTVQAAILAATANEQRAAVPNGGAARVLTDAGDVRRERAIDGLVLRARPDRERTMGADRTAAAREFRSLSFERLAEDCLAHANQPTRALSRSGLIRSALSSSDFPILLQQGLQRELRAAYDEIPSTFQAFSRQVTATDFRARTVVSMGGLGEMRKVPEGGEAKRKAFAETSESYKVDKFEEIITFTFEALVNDDLDALQRLPAMIALAARTTERRTVFSIFNGVGPTISDGKALFHADHKNLITGAAAPSVASLSAIRALFRKQTDVGGNAINLMPAFILSPTKHETVLDQLFAGLQTGLALARAEILPGALQSLIPIIEPMLDEYSNDHWFALAPQAFGGFEHAYLDGENGLVTEELPPGPVSGVSTKARLVFGAAAVDYRAAVRQVGA
jgi:hypothetical protein